MIFTLDIASSLVWGCGVIWMDCVEEQWYEVEALILNQDNLSAIMLVKNGRASIGKRSSTFMCGTSLSRTGLVPPEALPVNGNVGRSFYKTTTRKPIPEVQC
jgi:hypothetical protein